MVYQWEIRRQAAHNREVNANKNCNNNNNGNKNIYFATGGWQRRMAEYGCSHIIRINYQTTMNKVVQQKQKHKYEKKWKNA